jgi:C4-dicarboxylate transporter DctQ subunit
MQRWLQIINRTNRAASILAGLLTAVIAVVVCYAVAVRYVFQRPLGWSEEVSVYLMVWAAFLGAAYTLQVNGHIGVDVICKKFSEAVQVRLQLVKYGVALAFMALLTVKGAEACLLSVTMGRVSISELQIPLYWVQLAVPVGAALMGLQLLEKFLRLLATGRLETKAEP